MNADKDMLRQQAGMVDEGMVSRFKAAFAEHSTISPEYDGCIRAGIEAALAQNTQGDGEPVNGLVADHLISGLGKLANTVSKRMANDIREVLSAMKPLYLHAERARVPDGLRDKLHELAQQADAAFHLKGERHMAIALEALADELTALSAAPSQRAEVK